MICRLCLTDLNEEIALPLFDRNGVNIQAELTSTIETFLNLKLFAVDTVICKDCWNHLEDFYIFLKTVEKKQIEFRQQCEIAEAPNESSIVTNNVNNALLTIDVDDDSMDKDCLEVSSLKRKISESTENSTDLENNEKNQKHLSTHKIVDNNYKGPDKSSILITNEEKVNFQNDTNLSEDMIIEPPKDDGFAPTRIGTPEIVAKQGKTLKKRILIVDTGNNGTLINLESDNSLDDIVSSNNDIDSELDEDKMVISSAVDSTVLYVKSNETKKYSKENASDLTTLPKIESSAKAFNNASNEKLTKNWEESNVKCEICKKNFDDFDKLSIHFKENHVGLTPFVVCCGRRYTKAITFRNHRRQTNDNKGLVCKQLLAFEDKSCKICNRRFYKLDNFLKHLRYHKESDNSNLNCDICKLIFTSPEQLDNHVKSVHSHVNPYVCDYCGERFQKYFKRQFVEHLQTHKIECSLCNRVFKNKYLMERHKSTHQKPIPLCCHICKGKCPNPEELEKHHRDIHQNSELVCKHCELKCSNYEQLKEHMIIHNELKLYFCPHCPKMTNSNANITKHIKEVHAQEWIDTELRKICGVEKT